MLDPGVPLPWAGLPVSPVLVPLSLPGPLRLLEPLALPVSDCDSGRPVRILAQVSLPAELVQTCFMEHLHNLPVQGTSPGLEHHWGCAPRYQEDPNRHRNPAILN